MKRKIQPGALPSIASQLGVDLGTRETPPLLYGADGAPVVSGPKTISFTELRFEYFDVEIAEKGKDIIYHFWPPNDGDAFVPGFATQLQEAFRGVLPSTADVRADYTTRDEAAVLAKHAQWPVHLDKESRSQTDSKWIPRETYFVRVVGGAEYPLADTFLKRRVLETLSRALETHRG